jgi:hypothetical protein
MAYVARPRDFSDFADVARQAKPVPAAKPFALLRRLYAAIVNSREGHANRELAAYLQRSGGRLTDDMEREMMRRLCSGDWNARR